MMKFSKISLLLALLFAVAACSGDDVSKETDPTTPVEDATHSDGDDAGQSSGDDASPGTDAEPINNGVQPPVETIGGLRLVGSSWMEIALPGGEIRNFTRNPELPEVIATERFNRVAYTEEIEGGSGRMIYVVGIDGLNPRTFLNFAERDQQMDPYSLHLGNGTLQFITAGEPGGPETAKIWSLDLDGPEDQQPALVSEIPVEGDFFVIGNGAVRPPIWNPSGTHLVNEAFSHEVDVAASGEHVARNVAVVEASTGQLTQVSADDQGYTLAQMAENPGCIYETSGRDDNPCDVVARNGFSSNGNGEIGWLSDTRLVFESNRDVWADVDEMGDRRYNGESLMLVYDLDDPQDFANLPTLDIPSAPEVATPNGEYFVDVWKGIELGLRIYRKGEEQPFIEMRDEPKLQDSTSRGAHFFYE